MKDGQKPRRGEKEGRAAWLLCFREERERGKRVGTEEESREEAGKEREGAGEKERQKSDRRARRAGHTEAAEGRTNPP
jgi:hypothetical protein